MSNTTTINGCDELPRIRGGSARQAAYAENVRAEKLAMVETFLAEQAGNITNQTAVDRAMVWLKSQDGYKFWIDDLKFYNGLETFKVALKATV